MSMKHMLKWKSKPKPILEAPQESGLQHLGPDPFVESPKVAGIDPGSYDKFAMSKAAALIMFYNPYKKECVNSAKHFAKAAKKSKIHDHAFGAVDCNKHYEFCCKENVKVMPYFRLFAWGKPIGNFFYSDHYHYHDMQKWMEGVPIYNPYNSPTYQRIIQEQLPINRPEHEDSPIYENVERSTDRRTYSESSQPRQRIESEDSHIYEDIEVNPDRMTHPPPASPQRESDYLDETIYEEVVCRLPTTLNRSQQSEPKPRSESEDSRQLEELQAARKSVIQNHGFAALDCNLHPDFCCKENVTVLPYFRLFAWGAPFGNFYYSKQYNYHDMKNWMKGVPGYDPYTSPRYQSVMRSKLKSVTDEPIQEEIDSYPNQITCPDNACALPVTDEGTLVDDTEVGYGMAASGGPMATPTNDYTAINYAARKGGYRVIPADEYAVTPTADESGVGDSFRYGTTPTNEYAVTPIMEGRRGAESIGYVTPPHGYAVTPTIEGRGVGDSCRYGATPSHVTPTIEGIEGPGVADSCPCGVTTSDEYTVTPSRGSSRMSPNEYAVTASTGKRGADSINEYGFGLPPASRFDVTSMGESSVLAAARGFDVGSSREYSNISDQFVVSSFHFRKPPPNAKYWETEAASEISEISSGCGCTDTYSHTCDGDSSASTLYGEADACGACQVPFDSPSNLPPQKRVKQLVQYFEGKLHFKLIGPQQYIREVEHEEQVSSPRQEHESLNYFQGPQPRHIQDYMNYYETIASRQERVTASSCPGSPPRNEQGYTDYSQGCQPCQEQGIGYGESTPQKQYRTVISCYYGSEGPEHDSVNYYTGTPPSQERASANYYTGSRQANNRGHPYTV